MRPRPHRTKPELERDVAELRGRVEYLEDSFAAFVARAERDERAALRPWVDVRRPSARQRS
jgi:hypothetical protein